MSQSPWVTVTVFFSFGTSLQTWAKTGLLSREISLYQRLQAQGVRVQFVTFGTADDKDWESELGGIEVFPFYERRIRPRSNLMMALQSFWIPFWMNEGLTQSDLFKTNQMMGAWVAVIAKLRYRKPLLLRCGYEMSEFFRLGRVSRWHRCAGWLLSLVSYHSANQIHVATNADAITVRRRFGVPSLKIKVRPNWIDTCKFAPPPDGDEIQEGVLFVGRFSDQKNLPLLIEALAGTSLELTAVGGSGDDAAALREFSRKLGVAVKFRKRIANNLLPKLYRQCAVYVICSHYEGNPKTLLEAMACGCAVIGTDVPGVREVIDHEKTGILVDQDSRALRTAMLHLINDREYCRKLGKAARSSILRKHALDTAVEAEVRSYSALIRGAS